MPCSNEEGLILSPLMKIHNDQKRDSCHTRHGGMMSFRVWRWHIQRPTTKLNVPKRPSPTTTLTERSSSLQLSAVHDEPLHDFEASFNFVIGHRSIFALQRNTSLFCKMPEPLILSSIAFCLIPREKAERSRNLVKARFRCWGCIALHRVESIVFQAFDLISPMGSV
jgi:hypothetical protein